MNTREQLVEICRQNDDWVTGIASPQPLRLDHCLPSKITEVGRRYYGGSGTGQAINRHAERLYVADNTLLFFLDRNLDVCPPCYELDVAPATFSGIVPTLRIGGEEYWGDGKPWSWATWVMRKELGVELVSLEEMCALFSPRDVVALRDYAAARKYTLSGDWNFILSQNEEHQP